MTKSSEVTPEMIIEKCIDTELHDFIMEVQKDSSDDTDDFGKTMEHILEMFKNMTGGQIRMKRLDQDSPKSSYSFDDDEDDDDRSEAQKIADGSQSEENPDSDVPFLSRFGHNMVRDAKEGRFDPMIGVKQNFRSSLRS